MNPKVHRQIQPRGSSSPCDDHVREEIQNFLQAVASYPVRASEEPSLSFQQHLCSFLGAPRDDHRNNRSRRP